MARAGGRVWRMRLRPAVWRGEVLVLQPGAGLALRGPSSLCWRRSVEGLRMRIGSGFGLRSGEDERSGRCGGGFGDGLVRLVCGAVVAMGALGDLALSRPGERAFVAGICGWASGLCHRVLCVLPGRCADRCGDGCGGGAAARAGRRRDGAARFVLSDVLLAERLFRVREAGLRVDADASGLARLLAGAGVIVLGSPFYVSPKG